MVNILCIAGPTASGKSARAVSEAHAPGGLPAGRQGEVISVDSRQVYRGLDIGTEKITQEEMQGIPHHLIDIRDAKDPYSAGDFAQDAAKLIEEIAGRDNLPILAGGTHFYFDALLHGLPQVEQNGVLRAELEKQSTEELFARVRALNPSRARELDPKNQRRLIRALEIIAAHGLVCRRAPLTEYEVSWIVIDPPMPELRERIDARLATAFERGLIEEARRVRKEVGDERLNELGLEYRIVGEYLRDERPYDSLLPSLRAKLWQFARRQKAWLRKLSA